MQNQRIFEFLERIETVWRSEAWKIGRAYNLQPIQLQMLVYLSRCNRYSDSPMSVAVYFQLTKGTVSQSLKVLETRGFITRHRDPSDGRKHHLTLTESGKEVVAQTHPPIAFQKLTLPNGKQLADLLQNMVQQLQQSNEVHSFGVCRTCQYFKYENEAQYRCGLTQEVLSSDEIDLICREHQPGDPSKDQHNLPL